MGKGASGAGSRRTGWRHGGAVGRSPAGRGRSEPGGAGLGKRDFGLNGLKVLNTGNSFSSAKPIPEAKSLRYNRLRIELRDFLDLYWLFRGRSCAVAAFLF